jgi:hypothetical protein
VDLELELLAALARALERARVVEPGTWNALEPLPLVSGDAARLRAISPASVSDTWAADTAPRAAGSIAISRSG